METEVLAILTAGGFVESSEGAGEGPLGLVLASTSFYAESGGQVADTGALLTSSARYTVQDTQVLPPASPPSSSHLPLRNRPVQTLSFLTSRLHRTGVVPMGELPAVQGVSNLQ